jgi:hypothetical protein
MDGDVEVVLKPVNPEANATRPRKKSKTSKSTKPTTGLNAAELLLDRVLGRNQKEINNEEDGQCVA